MLGQHSTNYSEKATHSRGYADNDNYRFQEWCGLWLTECLRILKPGGHLIAFGGTRSAHRLFAAAEDTGFEIRDQLLWLYGTGAPKSLHVGAAMGLPSAPAPTTTSDDPVAEWDGWWTGIKPAHEPILLARKPLEGRVVDNIAAYGVGALNVDGCRVHPITLTPRTPTKTAQKARSASRPPSGESTRWPSNLLMDTEAAHHLNEIAGADVSRYFWVAKPTATERAKVDGVSHPTVKPLALMRQLTRLITPPGGTVLDPFGGSGTTAEACHLEGFNSITIEREPTYIPLIRHRLDRQHNTVQAIDNRTDDNRGEHLF